MNTHNIFLIICLIIIFFLIGYYLFKQRDNFYIDRPNWEDDSLTGTDINNDDSATSLKYTISGSEYQRKKKRGPDYD